MVRVACQTSNLSSLQHFSSSLKSVRFFLFFVSYFFQSLPLVLFPVSLQYIIVLSFALAIFPPAISVFASPFPSLDMRHASLVSLAQPAIYVALRKFQSQKPTTLPCRPGRAQAGCRLVGFAARRPQAFTFIKRSATHSLTDAT